MNYCYIRSSHYMTYTSTGDVSPSTRQKMIIPMRPLHSPLEPCMTNLSALAEQLMVTGKIADEHPHLVWPYPRDSYESLQENKPLIQ